MKKYYKDLVGKTYNGVLVLELDEEVSKEKHRGWWKCRCEVCGKEIYFDTKQIQNRKTYSCGCAKNPSPHVSNEIGKRYGRLVVVSRNWDIHKNSEAYWNCQCDCGNATIASTYSLHSNNTVSCGCKGKEFYKMTPKQLIDETGHRYGSLTVLSRNMERRNSGGWWNCQCDCGNIVVCYGGGLRHGDKISCGCKVHSRGEAAIENLLKDRQVSYKTQYTFPNFRFADTFGTPKFDFGILQDGNLIFLIEYNGIQHYKNVEYFQETAETIQKRDNQKIQYCLSHDIPLEIISYENFDNLSSIIDELLVKYRIKEGAQYGIHSKDF